MPDAFGMITDMRKDAVQRLYASKFGARMRVTVVSATCEIDGVHMQAEKGMTIMEAADSVGK